MSEVCLSEEIFEIAKKRAKELGFQTVDEYVEFLIITEFNQNSTKPNQQEVEERLRDMGYLD